MSVFTSSNSAICAMLWCTAGSSAQLFSALCRHGRSGDLHRMVSTAFQPSRVAVCYCPPVASALIEVFTRCHPLPSCIPLSNCKALPAPNPPEGTIPSMSTSIWVEAGSCLYTQNAGGGLSPVIHVHGTRWFRFGSCVKNVSIQWIVSPWFTTKYF